MSASDICSWSVPHLLITDYPPLNYNCLQWSRHPFPPSRASVKGLTADAPPSRRQDEIRTSGVGVRQGGRLMISDGLKGERERGAERVGRKSAGTERDKKKIKWRPHGRLGGEETTGERRRERGQEVRALICKSLCCASVCLQCFIHVIWRAFCTEIRSEYANWVGGYCGLFFYLLPLPL